MIYFLNLKQIADRFILEGIFCQNVSLFNGKIGMSLFFFLYARQIKNSLYEEFAGELLDEVCANLSISLPVTFADGLCGIGWCIEFMKEQGFIEGETDDILSEIDNRVMERDVRHISDFSFETGLGGIVAYVSSRLNSRRTGVNIPFELVYLQELEEACKKRNNSLVVKEYDVNVVWNQILNIFSNKFITEDESWKRGLILINTKGHE